jgi:hypothetical protein
MRVVESDGKRVTIAKLVVDPPDHFGRLFQGSAAQADVQKATHGHPAISFDGLEGRFWCYTHAASRVSRLSQGSSQLKYKAEFELIS